MSTLLIAINEDQSDHLSWVECDALVLSRRPEGEEFRAAEAGGKNHSGGSVRRELQDIAARNFGYTGLGYKEIARTVKGQAPQSPYF
jgi:hypothetical protein